jgi:NADH-quinone oxidoreductase subunit N
MTGIMLYGLSLCYTDRESLSLSEMHPVNTLPSRIGWLLIMSGLLFKLGVAPFHTWLIDLYGKAQLWLVMFLDTIWKFFVVVVFVRIFKFVISMEFACIKLSLVLLASTSMIIGSIMPIFQVDIRRFTAYASVGHTGFIITVLAISHDFAQISTAVIYSFFYAVASTCFFMPIISLKTREIQTFGDIARLVEKDGMIMYSVVASMFAMIALPPFANFSAKLQILKLQISTENYYVLVVSIIYSILCSVFVSRRAIELLCHEPSPRASVASVLAFCTLLLSIALFQEVHVSFTSLCSNIS